MSKLGTVLKVGATVLAAVGGTAEVVNIINQHNEQQIVEQYNYEQIHEINIYDTYLVNGEEVDLETFNSVKEKQDATKTVVHNSNSVVIDENAVVIYYGATDALPTSVSELTAVDFDSVPNTFTKLIPSGNEEEELGQWICVAISNDYSVSGITVSGFSCSFSSYKLGDYTVYYLDSEVYNLTGLEYTFVFEK